MSWRELWVRALNVVRGWLSPPHMCEQCGSVELHRRFTSTTDSLVFCTVQCLLADIADADEAAERGG